MPHIQQLAMSRYGDEHLAEAAINLAEHHGTRKQIEEGELVLPDLRDLAVAILHLFPQFKEWLRTQGQPPDAKQQPQPPPRKA